MKKETVDDIKYTIIIIMFIITIGGIVFNAYGNYITNSNHLTTLQKTMDEVRSDVKQGFEKINEKINKNTQSIQRLDERTKRKN